jgi:hypothetical protein
VVAEIQTVTPVSQHRYVEGSRDDCMPNTSLTKPFRGTRQGHLLTLGLADLTRRDVPHCLDQGMQENCIADWANTYN